MSEHVLDGVLAKAFRAHPWWCALIAAIVVGIYCGWDWVAPWMTREFWAVGGEDVSRSEVFRNVSLVIAAAVGLVIAVWRAISADRQTKTANRQADTANLQAEIAVSGLNIDRLQKGGEMLESTSPATQSAGFWTLHNLAEADAKNHYRASVYVLAAFIRNQSELRKDKSDDVHGGMGPECALVTKLFNNMELRALAGFPKADQPWTLDLGGAYLPGCNLEGIDLSNCFLLGADISKSNLENANLSKAVLSDSNLTEVNFQNAKFNETRISGANFDKVSGLTVEQLRGAVAYSEKPPIGLTQELLDVVHFEEKC